MELRSYRFIKFQHWDIDIGFQLFVTVPRLARCSSVKTAFASLLAFSWIEVNCSIWSLERPCHPAVQQYSLDCPDRPWFGPYVHTTSSSNSSACAAHLIGSFMDTSSAYLIPCVPYVGNNPRSQPQTGRWRYTFVFMVCFLSC